MLNWIDLFKKDLLEKCGKKSSSTQELAAALSKETKESITIDALFNAHRRHKAALKLKASLMDYMAPPPEDKKEKPKTVKPEDIVHVLSPAQKKAVKKAKKFIITSAQNNTEINEELWASINVYAQENDAEIIVIPVRYRNPTSPQECGVYIANWPDEIVPYCTDEELRLHEHLRIMGHVRVQPTAETPLSGLGTISEGASAIFGHPQISMEPVATPQNKLPKVLYTTGSISHKNYSDSKAGIKGEFHHDFGAVVVELDGPRFYARSVEADKTGGFYDLNKYYSPKGVEYDQEILALVTGDEHAMFNDKKCKAATYTNKDSIVNTLKPKRIVRHDVFDGYSISHHDRKNPVIQYSKHQQGHHLVEKELELTLRHIEETTPEWAENDIVDSNHHGHLLRWMKEVNAPVEEPWNAKSWLELWTLVIGSVGWSDTGVTHVDPFAEWIKARANVPIRFLPTDSNESIAGINIGMHGHYGVNGTRGTVNQFAKIGVKNVTGHGHSPHRRKNAIRVGTSTYLKLPYTHGPSSWAQTHAAIHENGTVQLIFVINGFWKL